MDQIQKPATNVINTLGAKLEHQLLLLLHPVTAMIDHDCLLLKYTPRKPIMMEKLDIDRLYTPIVNNCTHLVHTYCLLLIYCVKPIKPQRNPSWRTWSAGKHVACCMLSMDLVGAQWRIPQIPQASKKIELEENHVFPIPPAVGVF